MNFFPGGWNDESWIAYRWHVYGRENLWIEIRQKQKAFSCAVVIRMRHLNPEIDLLFSLLLIRSVDSSLSNISKKESLMDTHFFGRKKKTKRRKYRERKATQIDSHMLFRWKESDHADGLKLFPSWWAGGAASRIFLMRGREWKKWQSNPIAQI